MVTAENIVSGTCPYSLHVASLLQSNGAAVPAVSGAAACRNISSAFGCGSFEA